jgi:hypothetical protein
MQAAPARGTQQNAYQGDNADNDKHNHDDLTKRFRQRHLLQDPPDQNRKDYEYRDVDE